MTTTCQLCGTDLTADDARVVRVRLDGIADMPALDERAADRTADDGPAETYVCAKHADAVRLLRRLFTDGGAADGADAVADGRESADDSAGADPEEIERRVRGRLYQELDVLAFALEMEASEALEGGREDAAARAQQTRLGIRLAQRLVGGVPAPEVDERLHRWRERYRSRFPD